MRQSSLFFKTQKGSNAQELSKNAQLLTRAGFIHKLMGGAYSYMPLGFRTLNKIENLIRQYMLTVNGQEVMMPVLQPSDVWKQTGRWDAIDVLYDDGKDVRGGIKFAESDLIGIPNRITVGKTFFNTGNVEVKDRKTGNVTQMSVNDLITLTQQTKLR